MINIIWGVMLLAGIIVAAFTGNMSSVNAAIIESTKEAINLCIFMYGVVGMWSGFMMIAEQSGLLRQLSRGLKPFIRWIFPSVPADHKANDYIATNMVANMFGLGWASTPSGLLAMEQLGELNGGSKIASHDMCAFLILNISSLQLIPINMIAYRSQYGSAQPSSIVIPALAATIISTIAGIIYIKWKQRILKGKNQAGKGSVT